MTGLERTDKWAEAEQERADRRGDRMGEIRDRVQTGHRNELNEFGAWVRERFAQSHPDRAPDWMTWRDVGVWNHEDTDLVMAYAKWKTDPDRLREGAEDRRADEEREAGDA